jgi:LmbE family N-acetylglucosaminyl deacetylase
MCIGKTLFFLFSAILAAASIGICSPQTAPKKENVLYFFAHQDDEIDVAAKIVVDLRNGRNVYCAWLTKGDMGGPAPEREKESRAVMALLKVPEQNLFFLGYPDQHAYLHLDDAYRDFLEIAEKVKPVEIMSHAYEGGNIDHDAVSLLATLAAKKLKAVHLEFPDSNMYKGKAQIWKFLPRGDTKTLYTPMDKDLYDLKMSTIKMYPTQKTLGTYEIGCDKKSLKKNGEPYRVAPVYDYASLPAEELRYASTSQGTATFEMWLGEVKKFLEKAPAD